MPRMIKKAVCPFCGGSKTKKWSSYNLKSLHGEKRWYYHCDECNRPFSSALIVQWVTEAIHPIIHREKECRPRKKRIKEHPIYSCPKCGSKFLAKNGSGKSSYKIYFRCTDCKTLFSPIHSKYRPRQKKPKPIPEKEPILCDFCGKDAGVGYKYISIKRRRLRYCLNCEKDVLEKHKGKVTDDGHKWCPSCEQYKLLSEFNGVKYGRGYNRLCGECSNVRGRFLSAKYGITLADFNNMLIQQNHRCAICGTPNNGIKYTKNFCVDHDHNTGEVRGLLCAFCNKLLGFAKDNTGILQNAITYLQKNSNFKVG